MSDEQQQSQQEPAGTASTSGRQQEHAARPRCWVIVYNVSKKHNVGTLLRSCTAFGVEEACLVGSRQLNTFGSHGASDYVRLRHFATIQECVSYLRGDCGCSILGVEIDATAAPVQAHPFSGNTAFMLGNEGQGLSDRQLALCDGLLYIPQHGDGTASLNVTVAASIVLHHFALWARYPEAPRCGAKFEVGPRPQRVCARGVVPLSPEAAAALVAARRRQGGDGADGGDEWLAAAMQQHGGADGLLAAVVGSGGGAE